MSNTTAPYFSDQPIAGCNRLPWAACRSTDPTASGFCITCTPSGTEPSQRIIARGIERLSDARLMEVAANSYPLMASLIDRLACLPKSGEATRDGTIRQRSDAAAHMLLHDLIDAARAVNAALDAMHGARLTTAASHARCPDRAA